MPALEGTAERLQLFEREHAAPVIDALERGAGLASLGPEIPGLGGVRAEYLDLRETILRGSRVARRDGSGLEPDLHMPTWHQRMHADGSPLSLADIDCLIAYLLSLQHW